MTAETEMALAAAEKVETDGDDWRWTDKVFWTLEAAAGNERRPMVVMSS